MDSRGQLIQDGAKRLSIAGVEDARLEAELMLGEAAGLTRGQLLARLTDPLGAAEIEAFDGFLARRLTREPLAYILGRREFFGRDFLVTSDVLIPRPETELLVHRALELINSSGHPLVIDVGTGSGAIGLSILAEDRSARLLATDISRPALEIARENASRLGVSERADFVAANLLSGIQRPIGFELLIASNLPYVPEARAGRLQAEVKDFEPHVALFSDEDGLGLIARLMECLDAILRPGEPALLEIDEEQGERAGELAPRLLPGFRTRLHTDSSGLDRMLELTK